MGTGVEVRRVSATDDLGHVRIRLLDGVVTERYLA